MTDETKTCVVCGEASHRPDWAGKPFPACDGHSTAVVASAVAKIKADAAAAAVVNADGPAKLIDAKPAAAPPTPAE